MIATLAMYKRPELEQAHAEYWQAIRLKLEQAGIAAPEQLSQAMAEEEPWLSPDLIFSQTCGMPYRLMLHDKVTLIGTPDYDIEGCPPGYYKSAA